MLDLIVSAEVQWRIGDDVGQFHPLNNMATMLVLEMQDYKTNLGGFKLQRETCIPNLETQRSLINVGLSL